MRIAVCINFDTEYVFAHFGQTEYMKIYDVDDNKNIVNQVIVSTGGASHHELVYFLLEEEADVVICGGLGDHAMELMKENDIKVYNGIEMKADEAVALLLEDKLKPNPQAIHHCSCGHHH